MRLERTPAGEFRCARIRAHDGHLGIEVGLLDEAVHEAVRFERDGELEVFVGGGERLEIINAVHGGAAVEYRAVFLERLGHVRMIRCALEDHVLEQVRHAGLAVTLVPRADEHGQVHGHL